MIFQCRRAVWREDVVLENPVVQNSFDMTGKYSISTSDEEPHNDYIGSLYEYSHRTLSLDSDILNAFGGISKILFERMNEGKLTDIKSVFGLPAIVFDWALLWQPNKTAHRRQSGWPSWSWCGWSGGVSMLLSNFTYSELQDWLHNHTWIDWITYSADGRSSACIPSHYTCQPNETHWRTLTCQPPVKRQPHEVLAIEGSCVSSHQDMVSQQSPPFFDPAELLPLLHFAAPTVKLYLGAADILGSDEKQDRCYKIYDAMNTPCGIIWINAAWLHCPDQAYEFIVLSDARSKEMRKDLLPPSEFDSEWDSYHVMLVNVASERITIERIAVGVVYQEALNRAVDPGVRWKEIWLR